MYHTMKENSWLCQVEMGECERSNVVVLDLNNLEFVPFN